MATADQEQLETSVKEVESKDPETGKGLRAALTKVLAENKSLRKEVVASKAEKLITSKGYDLVEITDLPEDLDEAQVEATLERLQKERTDILSRGLKAQYAKQGLEGDDLDAAVTEFLAGRQTTETPDPEAAQFERVQRLAGIGGTPVPQVNTDKLHGIEAIEAGLMKTSRPRRP